MYMIIYYNTKSDAVCYLTDSDRYVQYALVQKIVIISVEPTDCYK